jgi:hypothetical protein
MTDFARESRKILVVCARPFEFWLNLTKRNPNHYIVIYVNILRG